jgi:hypothetical protein
MIRLVCTEREQMEECNYTALCTESEQMEECDDTDCVY